MHVKNKSSTTGSVKKEKGKKKVLGLLSHLQTVHIMTTTHTICLVKKGTAFACPQGLYLWFQVSRGSLGRCSIHSVGLV